VGLLASFDGGVTLSEVRITATSPETHVEIRTSEGSNPDLSETTRVAAATLSQRETTISLPDPVDSEHVLVWLTKLSPTDGQYQSAIGEIEFVAES